jgi:hypothetical protein
MYSKQQPKTYRETDTQTRNKVTADSLSKTTQTHSWNLDVFHKINGWPVVASLLPTKHSNNHVGLTPLCPTMVVPIILDLKPCSKALYDMQ